MKIDEPTQVNNRIVFFVGDKAIRLRSLPERTAKLFYFFNSIHFVQRKRKKPPNVKSTPLPSSYNIYKF